MWLQRASLFSAGVEGGQACSSRLVRTRAEIEDSGDFHTGRAVAREESARPEPLLGTPGAVRRGRGDELPQRPRRHATRRAVPGGGRARGQLYAPRRLRTPRARRAAPRAVEGGRGNPRSDARRARRRAHLGLDRRRRREAVCESTTDAFRGDAVSRFRAGVSWLHVRLDSSPKYYKHVPYTRPPGGGAAREGPGADENLWRRAASNSESYS
mmetsp:Transcript_21517/g.64373  ORF Transcript_21517/g.64373 Transcript_21517/m.64373 type:complete len:212 (+) Transcript_21517:709-1344(+)